VPRERAARRRWPRLLGALAVVAVAIAALIAGYLVYLDRIITSTFEGRRWSVPARVYAQPLELYPGRTLRPEALIVELRRLGYRQTRDRQPGTFMRAGNEVRIHARHFVFNDRARPETDLSVRFAGAVIVGLEEGGRQASLTRLEAPLIGSFFPSHGEDRLIVVPAETPRLLTEGLKVIEDRNFDKHRGFDLTAIARAAWANLRSGDIQQGGSTLTQQLVKSYFLDNRRTIMRKLKELAMAVILEARFKKDDLLNAYVNEIYLGQDGTRAVHGFGLGSQFYFNKPLSELDAAEIALLIAVIRGPSYYNPFTHAERAKARRDRVLGQMQAFGLIDAAQLKAALAKPLTVASGSRSGGGYYPAFLDLLRAQLATSYDTEELASRGYRIFATLEPWVQDAAEASLDTALTRIEKERGLPTGELEGAVVVSRAQTGEVSAIVGGRRAGFQGFNRALSAKRPVGSVLKPAVYLTALESGRFNLASIIDDAPIVVPDQHTGDWTPNNFDEQPKGPVPLVRALGDSLNLATVRLGMAVGLESIATRIGQLLDRDAPNPFPSLLLGAIDLTPIELNRLYNVFASGGFSTAPKAVISVEDESGTTLERYPIVVQQVAEPDTVMLINHALMAVMLRGTGARSRWSGHGVAGKTGTSDEYRDSWFAGFDANYLSVIWVGYDDNRTTGLSGSTGALRVWDGLLATLYPTPLSLTAPPGTRLESVDYETGFKASADCGDPISVPVPYNAELPLKPGCGNTLERLGDRLRRWFND
jgi:penicillin-binding protein 1B